MIGGCSSVPNRWGRGPPIQLDGTGGRRPPWWRIAGQRDEVTTRVGRPGTVRCVSRRPAGRLPNHENGLTGGVRTAHIPPAKVGVQLIAALAFGAVGGDMHGQRPSL